MSRRVFVDGALVEHWDDDEMVYRKFEDGTVIEERPYDEIEAQEPMQRQEEQVKATAEQTLREQLAAGVEGIQAARRDAELDAAKARGMVEQAQLALASSTAQFQVVQSFQPSATYSQGEIAAVRDAIADLLTRLGQVQQALAEFYQYRVGVDQNAVLTDDALLWLARIASGALEPDVEPEAEPEVAATPVEVAPAEPEPEQ